MLQRCHAAAYDLSRETVTVQADPQSRERPVYRRALHVRHLAQRFPASPHLTASPRGRDRGAGAAAPFCNFAAMPQQCPRNFSAVR